MYASLPAACRLTLLAACLLCSAVTAQERQPAGIQRVLAVDHVCAWPNLTKGSDGHFIATIFNQPCHASCTGDVDCWSSPDGLTWSFLGKPAPHAPETNRMNVAAGLAANGDLIVLASGWSGVHAIGVTASPVSARSVLNCWVCRSPDGGRTWTQSESFAAAPDGYHPLIPFGDLQVALNGSLCATAYSTMTDAPQGSPESRTKAGVWFIRSDDHGKSWNISSQIAQGGNETSILQLSHQKWLAAVRTVDSTMDLYRSDDDGQNWRKQGPLSGLQELNGHLLRLQNGQLLYTYGNRVPGKNGVLARLSSDDGMTWSESIRIVDVLPFDCGYPSSSQRDDGKIVTIWYAQKTIEHPRYHMGAAVWTPPTVE